MRTAKQDSVVMYAIRIVSLFPHGATAPLVDQDLLIVEASLAQSVGLLWTVDRPDAETST